MAGTPAASMGWGCDKVVSEQVVYDNLRLEEIRYHVKMVSEHKLV